MKIKAVFYFLFFIGSIAAAVEFDEDSYGSFSDFLDGIYGVDENSGLTTMPVLTVPMGGRADGMAGAFSAVCDDITFIEWNPAGSAMLVDSTIAFFHNNWIADTKVDALTFTSAVKNLGFGISGKWLYTPFSEYNNSGDKASKGYYSEAAIILNLSYTFFKGYYFPGISLGANLKGALRSMPDLLEYSGGSQSAAAFAGDIGLLTRVNFLKLYDSRDKNMSFALVARNLGPLVDDEPLPTLAVAGFSYKPLRPIIFSFDFTYPLNFKDIALSEKPYYSMGISVAVAKFLSMGTGFTLKSGGSRFTLGTAVTFNSIAFDVNYSLDLATEVQPLNRITIGVRLNLGDGGLSERNKLVDKYYLEGLDAYAQGNDDEALEKFAKALELNPNFDPAIEGVKAIDNFKNLSRRIERIEHLED
jgi:tetratricopeptide (TPR) repeat protein